MKPSERIREISMARFDAAQAYLPEPVRLKASEYWHPGYITNEDLLAYLDETPGEAEKLWRKIRDIDDRTIVSKPSGGGAP